ncbi:DUF4232 domain-containing protein [Streptomyces sp.]|uniref:DUF4232 domain-containing protein n=2 Tax=Streptomyces sp. TaxID=1931 RepID=UPI002810A549|nr:DUF4232 domain-containing protein [Streptomyces sp.]
MNRRLRTALTVTAALGVGLLATACESGERSAAAPSSASSGRPAPTVGGGEAGAETDGARSGPGSTASSGVGTAQSRPSKTPGTQAEATRAGTETGSGSGSGGDKSGYGQVCGTNDIAWSVSTESQAGGYFLVKATAKPGITCVLRAALPVVAFGSDGTAARPAEQSAGRAITLRDGVAAYAGVNPKTTGGEGGKELDSLIVSVSDGDPHPVSLRVGSFVVDKPVVTNWHTSAADAVPLAG